jgi:hypothetical protein
VFSYLIEALHGHSSGAGRGCRSRNTSRSQRHGPWCNAGLGIGVSAVRVVVPVSLGNTVPGNPWWFLVALLASLATFVALGACVMALAPSARFANGVGTVATILHWFSAGPWVPRALMPGWMTTIWGLLPSGAAADLFARAIKDQAPTVKSLAFLLPGCW